MKKKIIISFLFISISIIFGGQDELKKNIRKAISQILSIANYKSNVNMQLNIIEVQKYFENITVNLSYVGGKKRIQIEGVPQLPNHSILKKLLKNAIDKVWDYLLFPYIFEILGKETILSQSTIQRKIDSYIVTINKIGGKLSKIVKAEYILNNEFLPVQIRLMFSSGATNSVNISYVKAEQNNYFIDIVNEEVTTGGGMKIYTGETKINYSNINNLTLPTAITYTVNFTRIPEHKFVTTINISYKMIKKGAVDRKKTGSTILRNEDAGQSKGTAAQTQGNPFFGEDEKSSSSEKGKSIRSPKKAECVPQNK